MSSLVTSAIIAKETLLNFENNLVLGRDIDWSYSEKFADPQDQIGNTYNLRKPINVVATDNNMAWNASASAVQENYVTLVIDRTLTVPMSFSEGDLALKVERFSDRFIKKAATVIAARLDAKIASAIVNSEVAVSSATSGLSSAAIQNISVGVANSAGYAVGAYGTAITPSLVTYAHKVLQDQACPDDGDIYGVLTTTANQQLVLAQASIFNPLLDTDKMYKKGIIGLYDGITFSVSQSLVAHVNGAQPTLVVSAGTLTTGWAETGTLTVTALTGALNAGDVFQFPGLFIVNPLTKVVTDTPFQVQVLTSAIIGATSVVVSPAPISAGPYQNVSATANGVTAQLTGAVLPGVAVVGSAAVNLTGVESIIFHKQAIVAASPEFTIPKKSSMDMAEIIKGDDLDGFKLRFLRGYDMIGASAAFGGGVGTGGPGFVSRFDAMFGFKTCNPSWIVRLRS
jgi:hypothetical protein